MTISMDLGDATNGFEVVRSARPAAVGPATILFRRNSVQASRRAVLHVRAAGESLVPPELVSWYTERAFQFYLARVRESGQRAWLAPFRRRAWSLGPVFADLDAACGQLREAEGIDTVIVTAGGRGALAVALWADARKSGGADALILHAPELPARRGLRLSIACPVLVLTDAGDPALAACLGGHVTWLQLAGTGDESLAAGDADRHELFGELGRWLGAYMYGQLRDQLL